MCAVSLHPPSLSLHLFYFIIQLTIISYSIHRCICIQLVESLVQATMGNSQAKKRHIPSPTVTRNLSPQLRPSSSPESSRKPPREPPPAQHHGSGKLSAKEKYALIPDNFTTLEQVLSAYLLFFFQLIVSIYAICSKSC